ncbi:hypothetical protein ACX801_12410 [Arthrobacter bambusae]
MSLLHHALDLATSTSNSFPEQILLALIPAVVTILGGGVAVHLIVQQSQKRSRLKELCESLSFEMWETAYAFYHRTQEQIWRNKYGQKTDFEALAEDYEAFRVAGRVLEAKLGANSEDQRAKWLWHGVVDMLGVRFYQLTQPQRRIDDFIASHRTHPFKVDEIPSDVLSLFPDEVGLRDDRIVLAAFIKMLDASVLAVRQAGGLKPIHH